MLAFYLNYFESETKAGKLKKNFYVWKKLDQLEEREKARKNLKADIDAKIENLSNDDYIFYLNIFKINVE